jgi:hypothetical protein
MVVSFIGGGKRSARVSVVALSVETSFSFYDICIVICLQPLWVDYA